MTIRMNRPTAILAALALLAPLSACDTRIKAPEDPRVCWRVTGQTPKVQFAALSRDDANMETCAAHLEAIWKATHRPVIGAYAGVFIFIDREGVRSGNDLEGAQYPLLTPEGRTQIDQAIDALNAVKPKTK